MLQRTPARAQPPLHHTLPAQSLRAAQAEAGGAQTPRRVARAPRQQIMARLRRTLAPCGGQALCTLSWLLPAPASAASPPAADALACAFASPPAGAASTRSLDTLSAS